MHTTFKIPRQLDRQLIDAFARIAAECSFNEPQLLFRVTHDTPSGTTPLKSYETHLLLSQIIPLQQSALHTLVLQYSGHNIITVTRKGESVFDEVTATWEQVRPVLQVEHFARALAVSRRELKEIKLDEAFRAFPNEEIGKYFEARDGMLTRLETVSTELLFNTQKRLKELDQEFQLRIEKLNTEVAVQREGLKTEFEAKEAALRQREEDIRKQKSEFDTRESKYLRRQLRQDMLKRLADLSQKFELTKGTRNLRWPIVVFILLFLAFFGTMTVLSFTQTADLIKGVGQDISKLNWWQLGFLVLKQLGFAAAFLGGSWFFIKWNDRWFRQHADAEFMFKNLELDINRASWVVEMALEWKEEKGRELPPELLDRLTRNLFKQQSQESDGIETPPELASVLLGSAANLKIKAPSGAEIELDRRGLKNALKQTSE